MGNLLSFQTPGYEDLELSTQSIIKEALNRGIEVEIVDRVENFIRLQKGDRVEYIKQATRTSADTYISALVMENKLVTKRILDENGFCTPKGNVYNDLKSVIADQIKYSGRSAVVKPNNTNFGVGITLLKGDWLEVDYYEAVKSAFSFDDTILIEEFAPGKEYRFLVVNQKVTAILHRVAANVTGDGINTIEKLVEEKNRNPNRGKGYKRPLEKLQLGNEERDLLKLHNRSIHSIPAAGEKVYLRKNSNISTGGDGIDFTDEIPELYKEIAIDATNAVGANISGVDMIIDDFQKESKLNYSIVELNFNPALHIHNHPHEGKNRHVEKEVLNLIGF
ncbi:MAG: bifunctional glutamate--cysteine ligase GshA/glutathione synthetase GshB [Proteobacteria bacterium]|nr:bifunctional glutamate--cysteine ligase GshA/glutathione synthetase GshB [Pseudomonadota bacterium]